MSFKDFSIFSFGGLFVERWETVKFWPLAQEISLKEKV